MQTSTSLAQPAQADQYLDLTNIAQQNIAAGCVLERPPVTVHLDLVAEARCMRGGRMFMWCTGLQCTI